MTRFLSVMFVVGAAFHCCAQPRSVPIETPVGRIFKAPQTWVSLRDTGVVIQRRDYSCGTAALATLLNNSFGKQFSEIDLLQQLVKTLSDEEVKDREANGFSLLDLKRLAEHNGLSAFGAKAPAKSLAAVPLPAIVLLEKKDYRHFVVLKAKSEDRVLLADPSKGNVRMSVKDFNHLWNGIVLVVQQPGSTNLQAKVVTEANSYLSRVELLSVRASINRRTAIGLRNTR